VYSNTQLCNSHHTDLFTNCTGFIANLKYETRKTIIGLLTGGHNKLYICLLPSLSRGHPIAICQNKNKFYLIWRRSAKLNPDSKWQSLYLITSASRKTLSTCLHEYLFTWVLVYMSICLHEYLFTWVLVYMGIHAHIPEDIEYLFTWGYTCTYPRRHWVQSKKIRLYSLKKEVNFVSLKNFVNYTVWFRRTDRVLVSCIFYSHRLSFSKIFKFILCYTISSFY